MLEKNLPPFCASKELSNTSLMLCWFTILNKLITNWNANKVMGCPCLVEVLKVLHGGSTKYLAFGKGLL